MTEISQFSATERIYEVLEGAGPTTAVSFHTHLGRYDVQIDDSGGVTVYAVGKLNDQLYIQPLASNKLLVTLERP